MKDRIRILRNTLNLIQQAFGDKLGLKGATIYAYEKGKNTPTERSISDICRVYNANEEWLRTGNGPMFRPIKGVNNDIVSFVAKLIKDDVEDAEWVKYVFARYLSLPIEERKLFNATLKKLLAEADKT
jgi:transcriptional regulator with XRE-family HTH domain